ncbi:hypothetical protein B5566_02550 [Mycobacterium sp. MHSD3]|nr:hypothetical protein B5566_02550 [Mycobacterium sp. MHSD3]
MAQRRVGFGVSYIEGLRFPEFVYGGDGCVAAAAHEVSAGAAVQLERRFDDADDFLFPPVGAVGAGDVEREAAFG